MNEGDEFAGVIARLRALPEADTGADFTGRVMAAVRAERAASRQWLLRTVAVPAAACAVAAAAFVSIFLGPMPRKPSLAPYARAPEARIAEYRTEEWFRPLHLPSPSGINAYCVLCGLDGTASTADDGQSSTNGAAFCGARSAGR